MLCDVIANVDELTHDEWLDLRSTGIGGSDAGAIFGSSAYASQFSLWAEKSGRVERINETNEAMEWGNLLERVVAEKFAKEYDVAVVEWPVMLRSKAHSFMLANLDFLIVKSSFEYPKGRVTKDLTFDPSKVEIDSILEIKTTGIVGRGNARGWEDNFIPRNYELQGLHYSCVTGIENVTFAALVAGEGLIVRDREYSAEERFDCIKRETLFWDLVKTGIEPDPDGHTSTLETIGKMYPESKEGVIVQADDFILETYTIYTKVKDEVAQGEARLKELRARLEIAIGEGDTMEYQGNALFTYKSTKDSESFDQKAFKLEHPEIFAKFMKPKKGHRVFRMKGE